MTANTKPVIALVAAPETSGSCRWTASRFETEASGLDDVGYRVGYEDPTFFRRLFKRETGLSPAASRKKMAGIPALNVADHGGR